MNVHEQVETDGQSDDAIVGRGVLIDFYSFAKRSYDPFSSRSITAEEIQACAKEQNIKFEYGDILIVRTGWSEAYRLLDQKARDEMGSKGTYELTFAGLARGDSMLELLHDNYFSSVASDAPSFESWPSEDKETLHSFLLPRWGVPIGEMWDLDALAELCEKNHRYEFFFTSSPANVQGTVFKRMTAFSNLLADNSLGGVGSQPNAIAIF
jgi:kynurenine formamidase